MIIMLTDLGVRGGPSLSLSLARAETILVIDGHLHWCGHDAVGSLGALAWTVGGSWLVFSCARDVGLFLLVLFAFPGLWGFAWLFCWLCPFVGLGLVFQV